MAAEIKDKAFATEYCGKKSWRIISLFSALCFSTASNGAVFYAERKLNFDVCKNLNSTYNKHSIFSPRLNMRKKFGTISRELAGVDRGGYPYAAIANAREYIAGEDRNIAQEASRGFFAFFLITLIVILGGMTLKYLSSVC